MTVSSQLLSDLHLPAAHQTRKHGKRTSLDAVRWAVRPGAQLTGGPPDAGGSFLPSALPLLECDLSLKKGTLSRVRGLHLYLLPQTDTYFCL